MNRPDWRAALEPALALALEYLEGLETRPVAARVGPQDMLRALEAPLPEVSAEPAAVVRALVQAVGPGLTAMPSGRFFGWVIGGSLPAALATDWLTATWDQNAGLAEGTPAAAAVEQVVLRWLTQLFALPAHCSGALVTGAQMANTTCLAAARNAVLTACGWDVEGEGLLGAPPLNVLVGAGRHDTIMRSLRLLGLGTASARVVEADDQGRMRADALAAQLATLAGPTILCAQIGNVNSGAIDPMSEIADELDRLRTRVGSKAVWLHVDGAFGLWARASRSLGVLTAGTERADSWATDAHKWLNTPYDCGIALVSDPAAHRRAMGVRAAYLPDPDAQPVRSPVEYTPDFSRRARGFAVYAAIRELGRQGIEALIDRCCMLARRFADALGREPGVEILNDVVLNQVLVRFRDPSGGDSDEHVRRVVRRVQEEGVCYMTPSVWRGSTVMRISVSNWSTDEADVDASVASILRAHRSL